MKKSKTNFIYRNGKAILDDLVIRFRDKIRKIRDVTAENHT